MAIVFCSILVQRTVDLCEACKHFCISGHLFCKQFFVVVFFCFAPRTVKGLHLNFAPPSKPGLSMALSMMLGRHFPKLFGFTDFDIQRLFPCMEKLVVESIKETGYMHIQATKPDTVGKNLEKMVSSSITQFKSDWGAWLHFPLLNILLISLQIILFAQDS